MKVYVLMGDMGYDGQCLMGVYSTRELAEQAFASYIDKSYLKCVVVEKEIDAEGSIQF